MVISSRTPEGDPARCPLCGAIVRVEPSITFRDAPCPCCGTPLWFFQFGDMEFLLRPLGGESEEKMVEMISDATGWTKAQVRDDLGGALTEIDSLELVELVMRIEDELESE